MLQDKIVKFLLMEAPAYCSRRYFPRSDIPAISCTMSPTHLGQWLARLYGPDRLLIPRSKIQNCWIASQAINRCFLVTELHPLSQEYYLIMISKCIGGVLASAGKPGMEVVLIKPFYRKAVSGYTIVSGRFFLEM